MRIPAYPLVRRALFRLAPERVHALTLTSLKLAHRLRLLPESRQAPAEAVDLMGLRFPNRVGLAAGFDKNASCLDALGALGFGFIETGTVTPRPQGGQPKPRLFRVPAHGALINRMGFPNEGAEAVAARLASRKYPGILGINIGKNATTPLASAIDDYVICYRRLAPLADYVAINVSSPNTQGLRQLQEAEYLRPILVALMEEGERVAIGRGRAVPLLAKVSPDLSDDELVEIAGLLVETGAAGVIATNTTIARPGLNAEEGSEPGGLSGKPLFDLSQRAIRVLRRAAGSRLVIVGVGGIDGAANARAAIAAGADLIQSYTGLIYRGPQLVDEIRAVLS